MNNNYAPHRVLAGSSATQPPYITNNSRGVLNNGHGDICYPLFRPHQGIQAYDDGFYDNFSVTDRSVRSREVKVGDLLYQGEKDWFAGEFYSLDKNVAMSYAKRRGHRLYTYMVSGELKLLDMTHERTNDWFLSAGNDIRDLFLKYSSQDVMEPMPFNHPSRHVVFVDRSAAIAHDLLHYLVANTGFHGWSIPKRSGYWASDINDPFSPSETHEEVAIAREFAVLRLSRMM